VLGLKMADNGFDCSPPAQFALDPVRQPSLLAGEMTMHSTHEPAAASRLARAAVSFGATATKLFERTWQHISTTKGQFE